MTFKIEILTETGAEARQQMALFLGLPFAPMSTLVPNSEPFPPNRAPKTDTAVPRIETVEQIAAEQILAEQIAAVGDDLTEERAIFPTVLAEPSVQTAIRKRGEPSPGKARRTKAEIAEDDAAVATEAYEAAAAATARNVEVSRLIDTALISAGGERIDPNAEQDAADEAAETAASRTSDAPTLDDVRQLMGAVQRKHGMATAAKIPQLLGKGVAELTDAELPDALARIQTLLDGDTPASALSVDPTPSAPPATKQDLIKAMLDYALFADGQNTDQAKMPNCMADVPVVFEKLFGVKTLSEVPADGYGKAVAGIAEMKAKDPFKRARG